MICKQKLFPDKLLLGTIFPIIIGKITDPRDPEGAGSHKVLAFQANGHAEL